MSEQENKERPKVKNPAAMVCLHIIVIGYAVYMFYTILRDYLAGGPKAPNLATVILGGILLLGGSAVVGFFSLRLFRQTKAEKRAEEEKALPPERTEPVQESDSDPD